jgi:hypothetical protein
VNSRPRPRSVDLALVVGLAVCAAALAWWGFGVAGPEMRDRRYMDLLFQSDAPRVFENLTQRGSSHARSNVHPIYTLLAYGGVRVLRLVLQLGPVTGAQLFGALVAAGWVTLLYLLLRLTGLRSGDAGILAALGLGSGAAVVWLSVPETYALGSISLMLPLLVLAAARRRPMRRWTWLLASAASLGITVTNWMAGLAAAWRGLGWRRTIGVSVGALAMVTVLWGVQRLYFPTIQFFVSEEEGTYLRAPTPSRIASVAAVFGVNAVVLPAPRRADVDPYYVTVQRSRPGAGSASRMIAVAAWLVLLALGAREAHRRWRDDRLVQVILLCLAGQFALHVLYGEETMLYALHWVPLLILVAGLAARGPWRPVALGAALLALVAGAGSNLRQLPALIDQLGNARRQVRRQMRIRPADPWPRGTGHIVLARTGSSDTLKAFVEPGGSLSPAAGSFGISIWVRDSAGALLTTSDAIPLDSIRQRFDWTGGAVPPPLDIATRWYSARWTLEDDAWHLKLVPRVGAHLELVLRGVGPAGGPVTGLAWDGSRLTVNRRWTVALHPAPGRVVLGEERSPGWINAGPGPTVVRDPLGWGVARFPIEADQPTELTIPLAQDGDTASLGSAPRLRLPDPDFEPALRAQIAHLLMGTVGDETRSADPLHVPIPWLRTGAYVVVALARAGQTARARALAELMIRQDYYGGFGAEADAPGLGIWALTQVAAESGSSEYDRRIWPAIQRKADEIVGMLQTRDTIRVRVFNPIVPRYSERPDNDVVAAPPVDGLIRGRMDHGWPTYYVNAVSYLGLSQAATLAERLGHADEATRWRNHAAQIRAAWAQAFQGAGDENERTYITALWPSEIAAGPDVRAALLRGLAARRKERDPGGEFRETPLWTYFELAEAHQWLALGDPDTAYSVLRWFWKRQSSPGLYTWWEDSTENNSYHRWDKLRGWTNPPAVTPHYWTTAEVLLLQLDMLAMPAMGRHGPALVLGAGVPASWLTDSLGVQGLRVVGRTVDWSWDGRRVRARVNGAPIELRLGPSFPPGTPLDLVSGSR